MKRRQLIRIRSWVGLPLVYDIFDPQSAYLPPDAIVAGLSALTSLERLRLEFRSPRPRPNRETRRLPPLRLSALPTLTGFWFTGVSEYMKDFMTHIGAPQRPGNNPLQSNRF